MPNGINWKLNDEKITSICGGRKNWNQTELIITIRQDWLLYLAGNRSSRLVQILFMPFVVRCPCLSVRLSVFPFLSLLPIPLFCQVSIPIPCTVTMAIPGLWHHSAVVQCLCLFFNFYSVLLCFVWLIMSGLSNSVSISKVVLISTYFFDL